MPHFIGTDIIEIARIQQLIERWGAHFLNHVYTEAELKIYGHRPQTLAASFASKEAVMKLLGTGNRGIAFREIETLYQPGTRPRVVLSGRALAQAQKLGIKEIDVSLSHSTEYATATAIGST